MKFIQHNRPVLGASLIALGLALGATGVASAKDVTVNTDLNNISGTTQAGSAYTPPDGFNSANNVGATADFSIPSGALGDTAEQLSMSDSPVDFSTTIMGTITGTSAGNVDGTLMASNNFDNGGALADFLLGNSGVVNFDSLQLTTSDFGGFTTSVDNPQFEITDPTFSGDNTIPNLTGGTLVLSGQNSTLASSNADGQLTGGSGTATVSGQVTGSTASGGTASGGATSGGGTAVPTPSGIAMLLFTGIGAAGMGFARRRENGQNAA